MVTIIVNIISVAALIGIAALRIISIKERTNEENKKHDEKNDNLIDNFINSHYKIILAVFFILVFITRIYKFGEIPSFIQVDEAGAAYDAYCLAEYGVDRYLNSYPLYLINFGGGQSVLYAYATIPFIKLLGTNIIAYRLPELIFFLMGIVVCYILVNKVKDKKTALLYTFLVIISPWNIEASRQGLDCNLLAPMFMLDLLLLINAKKNYQYIIAGISIGITLYTYCLSWLLIPAFLAVYIIYMLIIKKINFKQIILMGIPIAIFATPLIYLLLLNKGYASRTNFGIFTIPKLFSFRQGEISIYNIIHYGKYSLKTIFCNPYGMYIVQIPLFLIGFLVGIGEFIKSIKTKEFNFTGLITIVFAVLLVCNLLVTVGTLNRANILYLPMLYIITIGIMELSKGSKSTLFFIIVILTTLFIVFEASYFNKNNENARWQNYPYTDKEIYDITQKLENDDETKDVKKYFSISNKAEMYIYTMLINLPSPYELQFETWQKVKNYEEYNFIYNKTITEEMVNEKSIIVINKKQEDLIEGLERMNFSKEETGLYCIMKNF